MNEVCWLWWIPALPLLGSAGCGILHALTLRARKNNPEAAGPGGLAGPLAALAVGASFALSVLAFFQLRGTEDGARYLLSQSWSWIDAGTFDIEVGMLIDPLSSVMTLVICGVGLLIHIYATGYMKEDKGYAKFFAYLNLFVAMMLMLVLSTSLLGLFVGWEGVGLCSYLLIGFWYDKGWPAEAGQKAFIVNRIGDACFLIGSFLLVRLFGTLDMSSIGTAAAQLAGGGEATTQAAWAALLLFGGACGKSAQLPLFVWLPDAMAGPTPVSALIHAATMVTAGIYLVVRLSPLFALSPEVMLFMASVGAATAFVAGTTALVQRDIKKVLAYSTVSQLGYMFLALGTGAWVAALFHVITHAFFKALLFLGAGSVITGMHHEQDMHKMGGLRRHMPQTFITFAIGAYCLAGLPLSSGFFSKDEILAHAYSTGGAYLALWVVGVVTAALTAFYTWRMVALTFFGAERFEDGVHPHESPASMTLPLMALAVLAAFGGLLGLPHVFHVPHLLHDWLEPVVHQADAILHSRGEHHLSVAAEWALLALGSLVALVFAHRGFHTHRGGTEADQELAQARPALFGFLRDAWRIDRSYLSWIVSPLRLIAFGIGVVIDPLFIDGVANGSASGAKALGSKVRRMADGRISTYGLWIGGGSAALALFWILGA